MKNPPFFCSMAWLALAAGLTSTFADESPRSRVSFDADWRFQKDDPPGTGDQLSYPNIKDALIASSARFLDPAAPRPNPDIGSGVAYTQPGFDDGEWRKLNLPHDWGIEGPFNQDYPGESGKLPWWGVGWYRKHFEVTKADEGKQFYLDVDGAMSHAAVWLNGKFVGGWPYGYASWRVDLTPYIQMGAENVVAIRLDNPPDSSRWYPGGGIDRNVWLVKTSPIHVAQWGTAVTTPEVSAESATVQIKVQIDNRSTGPESGKNLRVTTQILRLADAQGHVAEEEHLTPTATSVTVESGKSASVTQTIQVRNPQLWTLKQPNLYIALTTIEENGRWMDLHATPFGIRTIKFTTDNGFLLNGERVKLQGVCMHSDIGALGSVTNVRALERQLEILKEMGCNAIRTSHNPPSPELLDLCDKMGVLIMAESFDCWKHAKKKNDYNTLFDDWSEKDMRAEVRHYRNHPSIILWSIGNEIPEQDGPDGAAMAKRLTGFAHEEDPSRPTTVACSSTEGGYNGYQTGMDVFGYNYKPGEYGKFRAANPTIPLFGSETSSTVSSRGEYFFPSNMALEDFQVTSYDTYKPGWATLPEIEWKGEDQNPFVAGEFVWTGFDYLGEPTPYRGDSTKPLDFTDPQERARADQELKDSGKIKVPSRSSYFGIVDLAGFKKDRFYLYQSRWRPELPMAHILPHWNWPERAGQDTPVFVYTSGDEAELFLNGQSLGRKKKQEFECRLQWDDVKYAPGELEAVAYKDGKEWARDSVKTTGPAARLLLEADRSSIDSDGADLSYITLTVQDKDGLLVPRSDTAIQFKVSGPGEIVATDNGDPTDLTVFSSRERKAFNGLALVIARAKPGETGDITLTAESEGLAPAKLILHSVRAGAH